MQYIKQPLFKRLRFLTIWLDCVCSRKSVAMLAYILFLLISFSLLVMVFLIQSSKANASTRIKDVVTVEGVRDNILVGYGLVVGLNGTGDRLQNALFTQKTLHAYLNRLGVNTGDVNLNVRNVASATVTAKLPPFARSGSAIDVQIGTMGDAKSIQGGMLIATPLMGADGEVYAIAQGPISVGGFEASGGDGSTINKGVPTSGHIANGAIVEKEIAFDLNDMEQLALALRNPDITTAKAIADTINTSIAPDIAHARDPGTVDVSVPRNYINDVNDFLANVEQLRVETDQPAKVIIDEATGTIVMNENVRIETVAIAQGNLVVRVDEEIQVSQPPPLAPEGAETQQVVQTEDTVDESGDKQLAVLESSANLKELVNGLNALGIGPRDMITILQSIKVAGALQAEVIAR